MFDLIRLRLRALLFCAFYFTGMAPVAAQGTNAAAVAAPRAIAVFSQTARDVTVTLLQESTGSRLGNNLRQRTPVPNGALDVAAVVRAGTAVNSAAPGVPVWLIAPTDEDLFDNWQSFSEGARVAVPDDLAAAMHKRKSTQLLLFTRFRAAANLRALHERVGDGTLDGLGYYVDRQTKMLDVDTNQTGIGFVAAYTHFRVTLIDTATARVLRTRTTAFGKVLEMARAQTGVNPWDALTPAQKINALRDMMAAEIDRVVPELLTQP